MFYQEKGLETTKTGFFHASKVLLEISRVINSNLGLSQVFQVVHAHLPHLIDFDVGGFYLSSASNLRLQQNLALDSEYISPLGEKSPKNLLLRKIEATCRSWICTQFIRPDQIKKHPFYRDILLPNNIFYTMGCPILVNGVCVGSVNIGRAASKGDFTGDELNQLAMVANMLAIVVQGCSRAYYNGEMECPLQECIPAPVKEPPEHGGEWPGWMQVLGNVTTIVAREFRNPLVTLKMAFYSLARSAASIPSVKPDLEQMENSIFRMNKSLDFLLSLSQDGELNLAHVDINRLLNEVLKMVRPVLSPEVLVVRDFAPLPLVIADKEKLTAVFSNLIENAVDAMAGGGMLRIITSANDRQVGIIIEDNGIGVEHHIRSQLFSPFVSSKPQGAGLGLTICKRIIDFHGGSIKIHSYQGSGTAVCIDLPVGEDLDVKKPNP